MADGGDHGDNKAVEASQEGDAARGAERLTLQMARSRALSDLQLACAAPRRAMLEQAIAELDQRITALKQSALK